MVANDCSWPIAAPQRGVGVPTFAWAPEGALELAITHTWNGDEEIRDRRQKRFRYANREKHGYSLESAATLLESMLLPIGAPPLMTSDGFTEAGDVRHMHMAADDCGKVVLIVTTMRKDETVRVISFRRASAQEREQFHSITGFLEATVED